MSVPGEQRSEIWEEFRKTICDGNIKDQIYFLSLLVLFVGIVSLDTYYQAFNIKYQTLNTPASHVVFRGLTAILTNWYILVIYGVAALWLALQKGFLIVLSKKQMFLAGVLPYFFIATVLGVTYPLARYSGREAARRDMADASCTLPKIISVARKSCGTPLPECTLNGARLLMIDGSYLVVFNPLHGRSDNENVNIIRIAKEDASVIKTTIK